jgi:serine/threonine protein kinase
VHRDIKPGNLLRAREHDAELLKVLDFGLARLTAPEPNARRLTAPRVVLGTPKYMSPEQAAGQSDIDARSDLWSLGVVLYRALTGKHPFNDRGSSSELLVEVIHGVITRPSTYHSDLAGDVDAFFARALARDRTQRFQHADEMLEAYERATAALLDRPDDPADAVPILPTPRPFRVAIPVAADVTSSTSSVALDAPPEVTPRASAPASPRPTVPAPRATASVPPARPSVRPSASLVVAPRPGGTAARASVGVAARPLARRVPMALAWILLLANAALLLYRVFLRR